MSNFNRNLNSAQRQTLRELISLQRKYRDPTARDLSVYVAPTTLPAQVVEVRRRFSGGFFKFWRVEQDGMISDEGLRPATAENLMRPA